MEKHVTSLELSKQLKEFGFPQESELSWFQILENGEWKLEKTSMLNDYRLGLFKPNAKIKFSLVSYSAYLATELGEWLPHEIKKPGDVPYEMWTNKHDGRWHIGYTTVKDFPHYARATADTEADVRAKMLIELCERGLINPKTLYNDK